MIRVLPSQVVKWIDSRFPFAASEQEGLPGAPTLDHNHKFELASLVEMAGNIPEHLMILDAELAGNFVAAIAVLRSAVTTWENIPRDPTSGVAGMRQFDGLPSSYCDTPSSVPLP